MQFNQNNAGRILSALLILLTAAILISGCTDILFEPSESGSGSLAGAYSDYGYIQIWTCPSGASVYVNGEYLGETTDVDDLFVQVGSGSHKLEIYKQGYEPYLEYLYISPGETVARDIFLENNYYNPYPDSDPVWTPAPTWTWEPDPTYSGPVYVAPTRPIY
ncbi:PEGA domain-containing protein [Methanoculleus taiwanensis]|nr:PEGA domain-containing protein [Methanoculleus taiwanensis]